MVEFTRKKIPERSGFKAEILVDNVFQITSDKIAQLTNSFYPLGSVKIQRASEVSGGRWQTHLSYGKSIIVDTGGIDNLVDAIPKAKQEFNTLDVARALKDARVISSDDLVLKLGTAGAVLDDERAAEVIDAQVLRKNVGYSLARHAAHQDNGIELAHLSSPQRVLLENEFVIAKIGRENNNNAIYIRIEIGEQGQDILDQVYQAATNAGLEHWTVRGTVSGPVKANLAVITRLPDKPLTETGMEDVVEILATSDWKTDDPHSEFNFVGTTSNASSRKSEKWGKKSGNSIYSFKGHWHGNSDKEKIGGHIRTLVPQKGSVVEIILEPAKVVQLVKN